MEVRTYHVADDSAGEPNEIFSTVAVDALLNTTNSLTMIVKFSGQMMIVLLTAESKLYAASRVERGPLMLRWYHEDGTPHPCDVEECESVASAFALLETDDDQVVFHFCRGHIAVLEESILEHMKACHTIHYHVQL